MSGKPSTYDLHQFLRLDTGARPFPPRVLIEDAAQDVDDYIQETAPVLAQEWCETMASGEEWKSTLEGEQRDHMLNVYMAKLDTDAALHNAKMFLWSQCTIDDPE